MTIEEIRKGAPSCKTATSYMEYQGKVYYLKYLDSNWMVWFSYDNPSGWGLANQDAISRNLDKIKPL